MPSNLVKELCRSARNSDALDVRDDPGAVRLCKLKDRAALDAFWLLPLWSIVLRDLSRHSSSIAVGSDFHAFRLHLHADRTGTLKRVFVTSVQSLPHGRP